MRHPWFVAVLLPVAAVAGYAAGARPVEAQTEALPFDIGETVTFSLPSGGSWKCRIEELRGTFARCIDPSMPVRFGDRQPDNGSHDTSCDPHPTPPIERGSRVASAAPAAWSKRRCGD